MYTNVNIFVYIHIYIHIYIHASCFSMYGSLHEVPYESPSLVASDRLVFGLECPGLFLRHCTGPEAYGFWTSSAPDPRFSSWD